MKPRPKQQDHHGSPSQLAGWASCPASAAVDGLEARPTDRERLGRRLRGLRWVLYLFAAALLAGSALAQGPIPAPPILPVKPEEIPSETDSPKSASTKPGGAALVVPLHTVVIDPGHGGRDTGIRGAGGLLEKDVTLRTAEKLAELIEGRLGVRVVLTRTGDFSLPLLERTAITNRAKGQLFLSLHVEGSFQRESSGFRVYILGPMSKPGRTPVPPGEETGLRATQWDTTQAAYRSETVRFASVLRESLGRHTGLPAAAVQETQLIVLKGIEMPAVLIGLGHLTNPQEEALLERDEFLDKIAEGVFRALMSFLQGKEVSN